MLDQGTLQRLKNYSGSAQRFRKCITLEQLIVDNKRKRDTETRVNNAVVHQWRYGPAYGADMYSRTAANIDRWHPF